MLTLGEKLHTLVLFRFMTRRPPLRELSALLDTDPKDVRRLCEAYTDLCEAVFTFGGTSIGVSIEVEEVGWITSLASSPPQASRELTITPTAIKFRVFFK